MNSGPAPRPRIRIWVLFVAVSVGLLGIVAEGGARLWYAARGWVQASESEGAGSPVLLTDPQIEAAGRALDLDPYEMVDPVHPGNWRLRPGYRATVGEMLAEKRRLGRLLTVRYMEEEASLLGLGPDDIAVEINGDGFRGPPIDAAHRLYRILTLGDSCTFGSPLSQWHGYPRTLERQLQRWGFQVEVINAGVEGYAPANVLLRRDELRALRPEMTTLYIGWNALYMERFLEDARGLGRYFASARLAGHAWELLRARFGNRREAAVAAYERPRRPDRDDRDLRLLEDYKPSFFPDVVRIVDEMEAAGSRVVILTLPGLFSAEREPSPRAFEIGHLPTFTDNPFVLARMAERYNEALRELARDRGLALVDLDQWASETLRPAEEHFIDSVHLDDLSQERLGYYLADQLAPLLPKGRRTHGAEEVEGP